MNKLASGCTVLAAAYVLAGLSAPEAQAQVGIKAGASFGSISNTGLLPGDLEGRTGFAAGLSFATPPDVVGLGFELLYAQRGAEEPNNPSSRALDYIDLPAYLRVMAPTEGLQPFAYAGPQASFEIDCSAVDEDCPDTGRPTTTWAAVVGAGVRLGEVEGGGFTLEARYVYGLSDLELDTVTDGDSYEDRSFLILVGFSF